MCMWMLTGGPTMTVQMGINSMVNTGPNWTTDVPRWIGGWMDGF